MIDINTLEQRGFLKSRFDTEPLTSKEENRTLIQTFSANKKGKGLEDYLKHHAWSEDNQGVTKVYLVKDCKTGEIVFYFALSAGLAYKDITATDVSLSETEREIVNICVDNCLSGKGDFTTDEVFSWYSEENIDEDKLRSIIESRLTIKMAARDDPERGNGIGNADSDMINVKLVSETFPGIVLTHFCRNDAYNLPVELSFPVGFYVFWEIVAEKVLQIADQLGCQYLYLFAADDTEQTSVLPSLLSLEDWDDYEDGTNTVPSYKLVEYYKTELKFEEIQDMSILKPYYDFQCFSLIQEISVLPERQREAWIQHSDIDD